MSYSQALEEQIRLLNYARSCELSADPVEREVSEQIIALLEYADPYYWQPDICSLIQTSSGSMPATWRYAPERLPTRDGFAWFGRPLGMRNRADWIGLDPGPALESEASWLTALGWRSIVLVDDSGQQEEALVVAGFGPGQHSQCDPLVAGQFRLGEDLQSAADRSYSGQHYYFQIIHALTVFAACISFLEQRILVTSQQRAERHARKRLEREGFKHEPLIRVVELRRKQVRSEHHGDSEPVEWSHQWIVSGHWRQQWYPSLNANQPRWIMPYVKGPENKPLKPPRAKVFAVVR